MNPLKALTNLRAALAPKRCGATLWSVERGHRAAGFRERFHGRFGYPFNRPTIEREKFYRRPLAQDDVLLDDVLSPSGNVVEQPLGARRCLKR